MWLFLIYVLVTFAGGFTEKLSKLEAVNAAFNDVDELVNFLTNEALAKDSNVDHAQQQNSVEPTIEKDQCPNPVKCLVQVKSAQTPARCLAERAKQVYIARMWYKITNEKTPSDILFPLKNVIPWLDHKIDTIKKFYALDKFEAGYITTLGTYMKIAYHFQVVMLKQFHSQSNFGAMYKTWTQLVQSIRRPDLFGDPSGSVYFTDHVANNLWKTDAAFVERRLAGECPYLMRKVTSDGAVGFSFKELKALLNPSFDYEAAVSHAYEKQTTLDNMVKEGRLFVVYEITMNDLAESKDFHLDEMKEKKKKLKKLTSPIVLFVLNSDGELKVASIQLDYKSTSEVLTPTSPASEWMMAKGQVELVLDHYCQSYVHLGEVHFVGTVYCLTFRRHLSEFHPLYDFFKYHCEGTVPHIAMSHVVLSQKGGLGDQYFTMGIDGFVSLGSAAVKDRRYGKLDYHDMIKARGLDDERIGYYPFRDDARLIWDEMTKFTDSFIQMYYSKDESIRQDTELQSLLNEISADGKGGDGGQGKMPGFPASMSSRKEVQLFLVRFLWINIIHTVTNYANVPNFIPIFPAKLYEGHDGGAHVSFMDSLGDGQYAAGLMANRGKLNTFRYNRIFDYYDKVKDNKFSELVRSTHNVFHTCLQEKLEKRNAQRKAQNKLGYQIMEPKWITNSVHI